MTADPRIFETAQCLCLASRQAARAITGRFDTALRPYGLKATQFTLLAALELKGPLSIGVLAEIIGVDRTTLTRNLAVAEAQSLVTIRVGTDARVRIACIAARGRQMLRHALPAWRKTQGEVTNAIGSDRADTLRELSRSRQTRNLPTEAVA